MRLVVSALLSSVVGSALVLMHCTTSVRAGMRRQEEWRLRNCICTHSPIYTPQCIAESAERGRDNGLEATCGVDGLSIDRVKCH